MSTCGKWASDDLFKNPPACVSSFLVLFLRAVLWQACVWLTDRGVICEQIDGLMTVRSAFDSLTGRLSASNAAVFDSAVKIWHKLRLKSRLVLYGWHMTGFSSARVSPLTLNHTDVNGCWPWQMTSPSLKHLQLKSVTINGKISLMSFWTCMTLFLQWNTKGDVQ